MKWNYSSILCASSLPKGCIPCCWNFISFHYVYEIFDCIPFPYFVFIRRFVCPRFSLSLFIFRSRFISIHIQLKLQFQFQFNALLPFSRFMNSSLTWIWYVCNVYTKCTSVCNVQLNILTTLLRCNQNEQSESRSKRRRSQFQLFSLLIVNVFSFFCMAMIIIIIFVNGSTRFM